MKINVFAPINQLGYGIHSYNYLKSLKKIMGINWTPIGGVQCNDQDFLNSMDREFDQNLISLMIFHENFMNQFHSKNCRIGFPVFECDKIDDFSRSLLNQLDYIFVTSEWAKQTLIDNNVKIDTKVIREGVNPDIYKITNEKYINTDKFTFINVGKHETRKNTDLILDTFIELFRDKEAALIMHSYNHFTKKFAGLDPFKKGFMQEEVNDKFIKFSYNNCDIYFTHPIDNGDLSSLYNSANVGVFPSRAEGWQLPLIEALACGVPSICTDCTGQSEYITTELKLMQGDLIIEKDELEKEIANDGIWFNGNKGSWYKLKNVDSLKERMIKAYNKTYSNKNISDFVTKNFNWDLTAQRTNTFLKEI